MTRPDRVIRYPLHEDPRPFRWAMGIMEAVALLLAAALLLGGMWAFCALLFALAPQP